MHHNNRPEWLRKAPEWFQNFYGNDFTHLRTKVEWSWKLQFVILAGILGGAIAIICRGL